jgi:hypothetical protein
MEMKQPHVLVLHEAFVWYLIYIHGVNFEVMPDKLKAVLMCTNDRLLLYHLLWTRPRNRDNLKVRVR